MSQTQDYLGGIVERYRDEMHEVHGRRQKMNWRMRFDESIHVVANPKDLVRNLQLHLFTDGIRRSDAVYLGEESLELPAKESTSNAFTYSQRKKLKTAERASEVAPDLSSDLLSPEYAEDTRR